MAVLWLSVVCLILIGAGLANRTPVPNAVIWALLGLAAAFVPGVPAFRLDPRIALFLVLPPLVYASAVQLPWREFRANLQPIARLAIGLVAATTVAAALLAHYAIGMPWAVAFALGAAISPTDPVAATAVASRVGLPHQLVAILEGEGLVNDAVSLSIFRIALAVWAGSTFSIEGGLVRFAAILIGEPLYGWMLGKVVAWIRGRIADPQIEITVSLLTPFVAYLLPERLGGSGILATVAVGMYIGERSSTLVPSGTRLHATSFWRMIVFLLNGGLFITAGMELGRLIGNPLRGGAVLWWGLWIGGAIAALRVLWCALGWIAFRVFRRVLRREHPGLELREMVVIAWSGMRGPISLAAALSIPAAVGTRAMPEYDTVVAITAAVIVITLIGQGAVLPLLVRLLGLKQAAEADDELLRREQSLAEKEAAAAALECLAELERAGRIAPEDAARVRRYYADRREGSAKQADDGIRRELIGAERSRILSLRNEGRISDYALERLQRALDLREAIVRNQW